MATTIEQQVVLDEALVPSTQRNSGLQPMSINALSDLRRTTRNTLWIWNHSGRCFTSVLGSLVKLFVELPFEEEILEFIWFLGHAIINKCLTGKSSGYDSFWLSQAQILWGLYHTKSIDYAFLIWEDFVYQVKNKNQKKSNEMYYPRITKVIIHHFMSKDPSIPRRNKINWHYVKDDSIFSTIKVVSRHQNTQQYDAMLPIELTNDEIRNTKAYKEYYAFATGEAVPKPKTSARRKRSGSDTSITPPAATTTSTTTIAVTPNLTAAVKGKQPAKAKSTDEGTGSKPGVPDVPTDESEEELSWNSSVDEGVDDQERQETHISQQSGSGTDEGTCSKSGVSDVPSDDSKEELSWNSSDDEDVGSHEEGKESDESNDDRDEGSDDDSEETVKSGAGKDDKDDDDEDDGDNDEEEELAKSDEENKET
nr:hypothetical protein [Tanacetum cinerariifolium]